MPEIGQREWGIGAQSDSLPAVRQGLRRLARIEQHLTQVNPGLGRDRVELHGLAEMFNRRSPVSLKPQRVAQVVVSGGEAGPNPDRSRPARPGATGSRSVSRLSRDRSAPWRRRSSA